MIRPGAPLPGNSYAKMQALLNVTLNTFGTATYSVTADATALANQQSGRGRLRGRRTHRRRQRRVRGDDRGLLHQHRLPDVLGRHAAGHRACRHQHPGRSQRRRRGADHHRRHEHRVRDHGPAWRQQPAAARHPERGVRHDAQPVARHDAHGRRRRLARRYGSVAVSVRSLARGRRARHLRCADADPAAVEAAIRFRRQSYYVNIGDNANPENGNFTNWAVSAPHLQGAHRYGQRDRQPLLYPPDQSADDRRQRQPGAALG